MHYLGNVENGPPVRDQQAITVPAWQGIVGLIQSGLRTGLFAEDFPDRSCVDPGLNEAITGCNEGHFYLRLTGDHPEIPVPLDAINAPATVPVLELVQFCFEHASLPINPENHVYFAHKHYLYFSRDRGQKGFSRDVNSILERNRLAYELRLDGEVRRLLPPVLREALSSSEYRSEDPELNRLLGAARDKFSRPDFRARYDSLKDLWDAFERLKTLEPPRDDKKRSSEALIARVTAEPEIREMLDKEMRIELEDLGNSFFIRHANGEQVTLQTTEEIDYLFHRLFALIRLLLRSTNRGS